MRDEFYPLLADPSPESWQAICKLLGRRDLRGSFLVVEARELLRELKSWPAEVDRPPARGWDALQQGKSADNSLSDALLALCHHVREVDLYPLYVRAAREAPALRLRDGTPAVRLQRAFTGALQGAHGRTHRLGTVGQGDLQGSLCVEWWRCPRGCLWDRSPPEEFTAETADYGDCTASHGESTRHRLSVAVEIEVKVASGKVRPEQEERMEALRRRGEVSLIVRRCDEMVRLLVQERDRILTEVSG